MSPWNDDRRRNGRVEFSNGRDAKVVGIDGTWSHDCVIYDISDGGARLTVNGLTDGLKSEQFFLVFLTTGRSFRRCELAWINGPELGVRFLKGHPKRKTRAPAKPDKDGSKKCADVSPLAGGRLS